MRLANALMSINAVKGVEIGDGFATAAMTGEENADEMRMGNDGKPVFLSNHAGGILGGISTGQPIVARFAVKPTSSILAPRRTIDKNGAETEIVTKGRHDPCVGIRAVPVGEAMMALVLADQALAPPRADWLNPSGEADLGRVNPAQILKPIRCGWNKETGPPADWAGTKACLDQNGGVAREAAGIAGDIGHAPDL